MGVRVPSIAVHFLCQHVHQSSIESFDQTICLGMVGRRINFVDPHKLANFAKKSGEKGSATIRQQFCRNSVSPNHVFHEESGNGQGRLVRHPEYLRPIGQIVHEDNSILVAFIGLREADDVDTVKGSRNWNGS